MGLFGQNLYDAHPKIRCPFTFSEKEPRKPQKSLIDMAEEKFKEDRNLIMHLQTFLSNCRHKHNLPTRLEWSMQLQLLEKFPEKERAKQVVASIRNGYRAIAYEGNLKKCKTDVRTDKEIDSNIITEKAY